MYQRVMRSPFNRSENRQVMKCSEPMRASSKAVMRTQPGFVSANIHKSLDGTRVANYAQWRSKEAFEAMLRDREAAEHMGEAARIAESFEPHLYEVSFVDESK